MAVSDDTGGPGQVTQSLYFPANDPVLADLRAGTIVTVARDLESDLSYNPQAGDWWIHLRAPAMIETSNHNWQLTIKDESGEVVYGPAGEGIVVHAQGARLREIRIPTEAMFAVRAAGPGKAWAAGVAGTLPCVERKLDQEGS